MTSLFRAAFGDRPDQVVGAVPADPRERWLAAVVLGGQGWYARAAALLEDLVATREDPVLAALAAATLAAHRRQLGGHEDARRHDAAGVARLAASGARPRPPAAGGSARAAGHAAEGAHPPDGGGWSPRLPADGGAARPRGTSPGGGGRRSNRGDLSLGVHSVSGAAGRALGEHEPLSTAIGPTVEVSPGHSGESARPVDISRYEAWSDVLLGLAADAVGLGRLGEARRLVAAAPADAGWRPAVRTGWLHAEIELAAGRPDAATGPAEAAVELAEAAGAVRHQVKSALVLGVALATDGRRERAGAVLATACRDAVDLGLVPLVWPAALVLAEIEPTRADQHCRCAAVALHSVLRRADPVGRRLAERSPWVPRLTGPTG